MSELVRFSCADFGWRIFYAMEGLNLKKRLISSVLVLFVILGMAFLPVQAATSGSCGSGVRWSFNNGTLTISGTGRMSNYASFSSTPWCDFRLQINTLIIGNGVSNIGTSTFSNCTELTSVTIPRILESMHLLVAGQQMYIIGVRRQSWIKLFQQIWAIVVWQVRECIIYLP